MATIIAILLSVIVDRYAQYLPGGRAIARFRSTAWLNTYVIKSSNILERMSVAQGYLVILSMVLPLCIALFLLKLFFGMLFGSLGTVLFLTIALFYFLGNRDIGQNQSGYVVVHETSFGVLFWFAILGPIGAFLYWFLVASMSAQFGRSLIVLHALAAWIPARITGFIYALMGNFTPGFNCWLVCMRDPALQSSQVLQNCGQSAADHTASSEDENLIARSFIAWVVFIIVIVVFKGRFL